MLNHWLMLRWHSGHVFIFLLWTLKQTQRSSDYFSPMNIKTGTVIMWSFSHMTGWTDTAVMPLFSLMNGTKSWIHQLLLKISRQLLITSQPERRSHWCKIDACQGFNCKCGQSTPSPTNSPVTVMPPNHRVALQRKTSGSSWDGMKTQVPLLLETVRGWKRVPPPSFTCFDTGPFTLLTKTAGFYQISVCIIGKLLLCFAGRKMRKIQISQKGSLLKCHGHFKNGREITWVRVTDGKVTTSLPKTDIIRSSSSVATPNEESHILKIKDSIELYIHQVCF